MNYWLVKSEPDAYSFQDLQRDGKTIWEGVRNYAARNNLRAMKVGDLALFYHSQEGLAVVGIAKVVTEHYPDPTAEKGDWSVVELSPVKELAKPVPLKAIKSEAALQQMMIIKNSRLSVMPVSEAEFQKILEMGNTDFDAIK